MSNTENRLFEIATFNEDDAIAKRALLILKKRYDKTYHWCPEWDYLVIKSSDIEAVYCLCF